MLGKHEAIVARLLKVCDVVISWILQATVMYFICCVTPLLSGIELPLLVQEECTAKFLKKNLFFIACRVEAASDKKKKRKKEKINLYSGNVMSFWIKSTKAESVLFQRAANNLICTAQ